MFCKFACKLLLVLVLLSGDLLALSFRSALQMPESLICDVNESAITVNKTQVLDLMGAGASFDKGDSVICAFPENKAGVIAADSLANEIMGRFANKEIILTGYRGAAKYAGAIASRLNRKSLEVNQLKLITFCGEEPFDSLDGMYLSCRLNFSHKLAYHDYRNSPWIELPVSLSSELCSKSSIITAIVGGVSFGAIGCICAWGSRWGVPVTLISSISGTLVSAFGKLMCKPSEYLPSDGVQTIFTIAKNRSWGASTELDWRLLGD